MATIKDIASRLNLSSSTVSRALTDNEGVSEATRELVKRTAEEMNYTINRFAKNLVTKTSYTIGFMIPDISDVFFSKSAYGVEEALKNTGYSLSYTNVERNSDRVLEYLKRAEEYQYDGIFITLDAWTDQVVKQLRALRIPIVSLRRRTPNLLEGKVPFVDSDHEDGVDQVVKHLVTLGHRSIGFIGFDTPVGLERTRSYHLAAEKYGIEKVLLQNYSFHDAGIRIMLGYKSAERLLGEHPNLTALFAADDQLALGVLQYLDEKHIDVPGQISVIGYDDRDVSGLFCIQLSTLRQQLFELGYQAGQLMLDMIASPDQPAKSAIIKPKLIVRKTTGPCPR